MAAELCENGIPKKNHAVVKLFQLLGYTAYFEEGKRGIFSCLGPLLKGNTEIWSPIFEGVLIFSLSKTGIRDSRYSHGNIWLLRFDLQFICCVYKLLNEYNSSSVTDTQLKHGLVAYLFERS